MCTHEFVHDVMSTTAKGVAARCTLCERLECLDCAAPVFRKPCALGKVRPHFCHAGGGGDGGAGCGGGGESSKHALAKLMLQRALLERRGSHILIHEHACLKGERDVWKGHYTARVVQIPEGAEVRTEVKQIDTRPDVLVTWGGVMLAFVVKASSWTKNERPCAWWEFDAANLLETLENSLGGPLILDCIRWRNPMPHLGRPRCQPCAAYAERCTREREQRERERQERERLERERQARERQDSERWQRERLERAERERERLEQERLDRERLGRERLDGERLEQERLERKRLELERLERERLERERLEHESLEREGLERESLEREGLERERRGVKRREQADKLRLKTRFEQLRKMHTVQANAEKERNARRAFGALFVKADV